MCRHARRKAATIVGVAAMWLVLTACEPIAAAHPTVSNDEFVQTPDGTAYRLAGGAPIYVSDWSVLGGFRTSSRVSYEELSSMPVTPADGTVLCGLRVGGRGGVFVVAGGAPVWVLRSAALGATLAKCVSVDQYSIDHAGGGSFLDHLNATPAEGTFLCGRQVGGATRVFVVIGGAPVRISRVAELGGLRSMCIPVDQFAIDNAGGEGFLNHLNATPNRGAFFGTFIR